MKVTCASLALFFNAAVAIDNGLGLTPPMGWRSWNLYGADVNQSLIEGIMEGMVSKARSVDGVPTSLCDLGYCDVGLDDNWQACGSYGPDEFTYHNELGAPVVNHEVFPDFIAMTSKAHELGLTAGWYGNNCICADSCGDADDHKEESGVACYEGDVNALYQFGFDAVKLDGCGAQRDLDLWSDLINATGKPIMIENCHWGETVPTEDWCPWNFYRTSGDVRASFESILSNLATVTEFAEAGLSKPGCWAYPDMLEVGCEHGPGGDSDPGLTIEETRTHFGAWSIVSSPLTLSHDVNNDTVMDQIWPIIANPEAIAVNQAWAGHSGSPFSSSGATTLRSFKDAEGKVQTVKTADSQYFYKPMKEDGSEVAVLLINQMDDDSQDLTLNFSDVPGLSCSTCSVRCIWGRKDLGDYTDSFTFEGVAAHDSAFLMITSAEAAY